MAETRGWTAGTVTPLYLRKQQDRASGVLDNFGSVSRAGTGAVSGGALPRSGSGRVSNYRFATQNAVTSGPSSIPNAPATPGSVSDAAKNLGPGSDKPALDPLKVYGLSDFAASTEGLNDKSLGSRAYTSVAGGQSQNVPVSVSAFQGGNVPQFLQGQIAQLNAEQFSKRSLQQEFIDRLFDRASQGDYQAWEALRGVGVQPGASVAFGSGITDPAVQTAQAANLDANTGLTQSQTKAVDQPGKLLNEKQKLEARKAQLGSTAFGFYDGSEQQKIDRQLMELNRQLRDTSATTQVATAAARPNVLKHSGFVAPVGPALPRF